MRGGGGGVKHNTRSLLCRGRGCELGELTVRKWNGEGSARTVIS